MKIIGIFILLAFLIIEIAVEVQDWREIERDVYKKYHLERTPLEVRTDSELGSNDRTTIFFSNSQGHYAGGINLWFGTTVRVWIYDCSSNSSIDLPVELLGTDVDRTWRIALKRGPGMIRHQEETGEGGEKGVSKNKGETLDPEVRLLILCNEVEVLNLLLSSNVCGDSSWRIDYSRTVEEIEFEVYDSASDYFRPAPEPCFAGTYRSANQMTCDPCQGDSISDAGASSCVPCHQGLVANPQKTGCGPEIDESENTSSGSSILMLGWIFAGLFFLTTIFAVIFAARTHLQKNRESWNILSERKNEESLDNTFEGDDTVDTQNLT
ncbi:hypothetical protein ACHWQZ_G006215 [Mnemiopsis leidyi]